MIDADNIDLSPLPRIAGEIYNLAKEIDETYCDLRNLSLKGIGIDGHLVVEGLKHVFEKESGIKLDAEPIEINSHEGEISFDKKKMNEFKVELEKSEYDKIILLVDKRSKTGSLGSWLEQEYPAFNYAVLTDLSGKAALSATNEDFAWIRWGDGLKEAYENAFKVLGLKIDRNPDGIYSYTFQKPEHPLFMEQFYYELDNAMAQGKRKPADEIDEERFE